MNELDIDLSKKSKIIKIRSEKKSWIDLKLVIFRKNHGFPGFSYLDFGIMIPKLSQILQKLQKVFPIDRISFFTRF